MPTLKSCWTRLSFLYHSYLYTKMAGFVVWLMFSSTIFMTTTDGILLNATPTEILGYMVSAQVVGFLLTWTLLFLPRLLLRIPIAFGLFDEKP